MATEQAALDAQAYRLMPDQNASHEILKRRHPIQKKDTSVTFWAERNFFCHTYDTSMKIIVTKPGIIIDVVGSYFYDKKS